MIGDARHPGARMAQKANGGVYEQPRCRDCLGYADPTATHSDCTFRGVRKAGYAAACTANRRREPNGRRIRTSLFKPRPEPKREDGIMAGAFECETCHQTFDKAQALGAHHRYVHPKPSGGAAKAGGGGEISTGGIQQRDASRDRSQDVTCHKEAGEAEPSTYACWNRAMVPSCPLRADDGDCGVLDELPHTIAECKAAAMPIDTSTPPATCDDAPSISEVSTSLQSDSSPLDAARQAWLNGLVLDADAVARKVAMPEGWWICATDSGSLQVVRSADWGPQRAAECVCCIREAVEERAVAIEEARRG